MRLLSLIFLSLCFFASIRAESTLQDVATRPISPNNLNRTDSQNSPQCPDGFVLYQNDCFYVSDQEATWNEAKLECESLNSSLLIAPTKVVIDFSVNLFEELELDGRYLIGAYLNDSNWYWLNGQELGSHGPWWRDSNSSNECVEMQVLGLHKIPCENYTNYFICQSNALISSDSLKKLTIGDRCDENDQEPCEQGLECIESQCKCFLVDYKIKANLCGIRLRNLMETFTINLGNIIL
ncbi:early activation antigen CD69-like [Brachionus plicatilis]|uniref:Early activation antigen CD69-like n=1 Tax=Brachionus plicatilis TaxID=10195 RepID=A0A3M7S049_BRAPC|nr:early activation antigen CD69-like [Brachionus plicatilis]